MDYNKAKEIADQIVSGISSSCIRAEIAGSIRREKKEVKDIEIVAIVDDYNTLYESLKKFGRFIKPGVPEIVDWPPKAGAKYIRMLINEEIKLDLFVASQENWGALFTMRTGPAAGPDGSYGFVPAMFTAWKRKSGGGRMMNCLPTTPQGVSINVLEEEDFFKVCGVQWIPPQLRISGRDVKKIKE